MTPIYFPFTHISDSVMRALSACFPQCDVYLPSNLHIPEVMQDWQRQGRLDFRVPVVGDEARLASLLEDYRQWAEMHLDHQRHLMPQLQAYRPSVPFFDDQSASHIKSRLKQMIEPKAPSGASTRRQIDFLHMCRLFLSIAQELDVQRHLVDAEMHALSLMEQSLFAQLQGHAQFTPDSDLSKQGSRSLDSRDYMILERLQAWSYLMLQDVMHHPPIPSAMFVTSNRLVYELLKENLPSMKSLGRIDGIPLYDSQMESKFTDFQRRLTTQLDHLVHSESPDIDRIQVDPPPNPKNRTVFLSIHKAQNLDSVALFSHFIRENLATLPSQPRLPNSSHTLIGYMDYSPP